MNFDFPNEDITTRNEILFTFTRLQPLSSTTSNAEFDHFEIIGSTPSLSNVERNSAVYPLSYSCATFS